MKEWMKIYEVPELKQKIIGINSILLIGIESNNEVLDDVVQEYVKKIGKNKKGDKDEEEEKDFEEYQDGKEDDLNNAKDAKSDSDFYYYSKEDKQYKVYNPKTKKWSAQP